MTSIDPCYHAPLHLADLDCACSSFWSMKTEFKWAFDFGETSLICSCLEANLNLRSNELVITPIELKPMSAPAIDGVSIVPVTGSNIPAAMGIPTCMHL